MENCYPVARRVNNRVGCTGTDWVIQGRVGEESLHAKVYGACCKENCDYVMKIELGSNTDSENELQIMAAEIGLAPKIVDSFTCNNKSFIVMEALNQTAFDLILRYKDPKVHLSIIDECFSLLKRIHSYGYAHGDSHLNNFMVKYSRENMVKSLEESDPVKSYKALAPKYFLIDFGYSGRIDDVLTAREDYIKIYIHLNRHYENTLLDEELSIYAPVLEKIMREIAKQ